MKELFDQVKVAADHGLYYLALFAALTIPDICAALEAPDGEAHGHLYEAWFDKWVLPRSKMSGETGFNGTDCYRLRCSMLHQGTTQKTVARYRRYVFIPGRGVHRNVFRHVEVSGFPSTSFVQFSTPEFCDDILSAAFAWWAQMENDANVKRNYGRFMRLYPAGYPPDGSWRLFGGPVIT